MKKKYLTLGDQSNSEFWSVQHIHCPLKFSCLVMIVYKISSRWNPAKNVLKNGHDDGRVHRPYGVPFQHGWKFAKLVGHKVLILVERDSRFLELQAGLPSWPGKLIAEARMPQVLLPLGGLFFWEFFWAGSHKCIFTLRMSLTPNVSS